MVARGAGLDAARSRQIGGDGAADAAGTGFAAKEHAVIHRLEGEFLVARRHQRLDFRKRRSGLGREHQFLGFVKRDAGQRRKVERRVPLRGAADDALAAAADDFQGLTIGNRPADCLFDFLGVTGGEAVGHVRLPYSAASAAGVARAKFGMISRAKRRSCSLPPLMVRST